MAFKPIGRRKKLHLLNALFIDPTLDLWIAMWVCVRVCDRWNRRTIWIIGLKKTDALFSPDVSLALCALFRCVLFCFVLDLFVFFFSCVSVCVCVRVYFQLECWTIIVICGKRHLQNAKENIATTQKHTKADHLHFRWGCQCDVCCNVVIHCDSHTSSLLARRLQRQRLRPKRISNTAQQKKKLSIDVDAR